MKRWHEVATAADFAETDRKQWISPDGRDVGIFKVGGDYFAVSNICTHAHALMLGGILEGDELECPLHGARFDLRTGAVVAPPASRPLATYKVKVEDEKVYVKA